MVVAVLEVAFGALEGAMRYNASTIRSGVASDHSYSVVMGLKRLRAAYSAFLSMPVEQANRCNANTDVVSNLWLHS